MNAVVERKKIIRIFLAILVFVCLAILPEVQAVIPTPDGCYPNYTTAEGCNALFGLGAGSGNTAIGWYSLSSAGDSNFSTGVGGGTLALNTADSNTAVGAAAMLLNTGGTLNVAVGTDAMVFNGSGANNTAVGAFALENNVAGATNAALGTFAAQNTTSTFNTAIGGFALQANTTGTRNTAVGAGAMETGTAGDDNTAVGELAGNGITGGSNTVLGSGAGTGITSAINVVAIGDGTGSNINTASGNIYIGHNVNPPGPGFEFNTVRIGDNLPTGAGASQCFIGGILSNMQPPALGVNRIVTISVTPGPTFGRLGFTIDAAEGSPKVAALQKKIEEQQASIAQLTSEMQTMVAQLKEQSAEIQKVNARFEMSKTAPQVVVNKR